MADPQPLGWGPSWLGSQQLPRGPAVLVMEVSRDLIPGERCSAASASHLPTAQSESCRPPLARSPTGSPSVVLLVYCRVERAPWGRTRNAPVGC